MHPAREGLQVGHDARDGAVGEATGTVRLELGAQGVEEDAGEAGGPALTLVAPLLQQHEGEEAVDVLALHAPGALGGGDPDGEVGLRPGA